MDLRQTVKELCKEKKVSLNKLEKELRGKINDWLEKKMPILIKETIQEEIDKVLS